LREGRRVALVELGIGQPGFQGREIGLEARDLAG
jgi:hypothetical protein